MPNSGRPRLVFFGNEQLATGTTTSLPHIRMLLEAGYDIAAVITKAAPSKKPNQIDGPIITFAKQQNIPIFTPSKLNDIAKDIVALEADMGVLVAYGKIVPEGIISLFPRGILNVHPSLLPLHRGPTPIESVILNGEAETGVSLMSLVKAMDAGPVYAQSTLRLTGKELKQELCDSLSDISVSMLRELLPEILSGDVVAAPQDHQDATYDSLIEKHDGFVDWKKPAVQIEREIRAYASWPKSVAKLGNLEVIILDANIANVTPVKPGTIHVTNNALKVDCGQNSLVINRLQPIGKKPMDIEDFLRGYGNRL